MPCLPGSVDEAAGFANTYHTWKGPQEVRSKKLQTGRITFIKTPAKPIRKIPATPQSH